MQLFWRSLRLGDIAAIFLCIVIGVAVLLFVFNPKIPKPGSNFGFGPDWDCTNLPQSEPVCVKRVPHGPADATKPPS